MFDHILGTSYMPELDFFGKILIAWIEIIR